MLVGVVGGGTHDSRHTRHRENRHRRHSGCFGFLVGLVVLKNTDWFWCAQYDNATLDEPQFVAPSPEHEPREGFKRVKITKTGSSTKAVTALQRTQGTHRKAGSGAQASCYVCRKYYGPQDPIYTTFKCEDCGTPLCKLDRTTQDKTRLCSCFFEHKNSLEKWMRERARGERRAQEDAENEDRVGEGGEGHRAPVEGPLNRSRSGQGRTGVGGHEGVCFAKVYWYRFFSNPVPTGKLASVCSHAAI